MSGKNPKSFFGSFKRPSLLPPKAYGKEARAFLSFSFASPGAFLSVDRAEEKRHVLAGADAAKRCDAKWEQWTTAAPIGKRDDECYDNDNNNNNNTASRENATLVVDDDVTKKTRAFCTLVVRSHSLLSSSVAVIFLTCSIIVAISRRRPPLFLSPALTRSLFNKGCFS